MGYAFCRHGATVAQLICNQWVAGSIPVAGTMHFKAIGKTPMAFVLLRRGKVRVIGQNVLLASSPNHV